MWEKSVLTDFHWEYWEVRNPCEAPTWDRGSLYVPVYYWGLQTALCHCDMFKFTWKLLSHYDRVQDDVQQRDLLRHSGPKQPPGFHYVIDTVTGAQRSNTKHTMASMAAFTADRVSQWNDTVALVTGIPSLPQAQAAALLKTWPVLAHIVQQASTCTDYQQAAGVFPQVRDQTTLIL